VKGVGEEEGEKGKKKEKKSSVHPAPFFLSALQGGKGKKPKNKGGKERREKAKPRKQALLLYPSFEVLK